MLKQNEAKELGAWWRMENCAELQGELKSERPGTPGQLPWPWEAQHHQGAGRSRGLTVSTITRAADPERWAMVLCRAAWEFRAGVVKLKMCEQRRN